MFPLSSPSPTMAAGQYVPRAIQIDSHELDAHFVNTFASKFDQIDLLRLFTAELKLVFQVYLWYKKQYLSNSSIGLDTFKLKFYDSLQPGKGLNTLQKYSFLIPVGLLYLKDRLSPRLDLNTSLKLEKLGALFQLANIVNTFLLIFGGRYRSLQERLFSVRVELEEKLPHDSVSYTFLNRELIWRSFSEILTLLLPNLMASTRLKSALQLIQRQLTRPRSVLLNSYVQSSDLHPISISCCTLCGHAANNAASFAQCKHLYCYYCLANRLTIQNCHTCDACNATIQSLDQLVDRIAI